MPAGAWWHASLALACDLQWRLINHCLRLPVPEQNAHSSPNLHGAPLTPTCPCLMLCTPAGSPRSPHFNARRARPPTVPTPAGVRKLNVKGRGGSGGRGGLVGGAVGLRHSSVKGAADLHRPPRPQSAVRSSLDAGRCAGVGGIRDK